MKKTIKCGIVATIVVTAGFAAYQSYGSYGSQDNSLLMQNIEALASGSDAGDGDNGDGNSENPKFRRVRCYVFEANVGTKEFICPQDSDPSVWVECPNEKKTAAVDSLWGYCLKEL
jgi:hypothetical protein